jgi:uracil-DNA glycosylase
MDGTGEARNRREHRKDKTTSTNSADRRLDIIASTRTASNMTKPRKTAKPTGSAADFIPPRPTIAKLRAASKGCQGCDLFKLGTQTVFGEGPSTAHVMVVGEQPGDMEDRAGKPFVGPSGKLLDRAFDGAGIDRDDVYVTNAVKHFKWEARGKRRIHQKPNAAELAACRPWLDAELEAVSPKVLVVLGATAAQALLGRQFRVTKERGGPVESNLAPHVVATVHPSSILRQRTNEERAAAMKDFVSDLEAVARLLARN